jgi:hypothetical protein
VRKTVRRIGWVGLVCSLAVAIAVVGVIFTHPRNEGAYLNYVVTYGDYHGQGLSSPPPSEVLIKAGDRACDWLQRRPMALWRTDQKYRINFLYPVYRADMSKADRDLPEAIPAGAWEYLCPATKAFIKPHDVFGHANSD